MSQHSVDRARRDGGPDDPAPLPTPAAQQPAGSDDLDNLLDEIDDVLESNAEEFVRSFVQKGGQ